jgi:hypothetical protein
MASGWRIFWTCQGTDKSGGTFAAKLYKSDGTFVAGMVNITNNDAGIYTLYDISGDFYLEVDTNSEQWTIKAQVFE